MNKSERHSKITGDFGEQLILYLLSKNGFEVVKADYIGIDIVASNKMKKQFIGISVKSRSRTRENKEKSFIISKDNYEKLVKSCETFNCDPWMVFVVDRPDPEDDELWQILIFMMSLKKVLKFYPDFTNSKDLLFSYSKKTLQRYNNDEEIIKTVFSYKPFCL